jgi:hypothetical protein
LKIDTKTEGGLTFENLNNESKMGITENNESFSIIVTFNNNL